MKKSKNDRVMIFDTTLRDGEQCPGASLNQREKIEIAQQLARLKLDVIEAGFPIASPEDFRAVQAVAAQVGDSTCRLARSLEKDIVRCAEAVGARRLKARPHPCFSGHFPHPPRVQTPQGQAGNHPPGRGRRNPCPEVLARTWSSAPRTLRVPSRNFWRSGARRD